MIAARSNPRRELLRNLRDRGFEGSNEKLAVAVGRPVEEITDWDSESAVVDDDVIMKVRGIAQEREIEIE